MVRSIWNADNKHRTSSKCVTFNTQKYITRLKEVGSIYHKRTYPLTQNFTDKIISKNYAQKYITQIFTVAFFNSREYLEIANKYIYKARVIWLSVSTRMLSYIKEKEYPTWTEYERISSIYEEIKKQVSTCNDSIYVLF